jgi:acyl carrier protein
MSDLANRIKSIIAEKLEIKETDIKPDANLIDLGADSLGLTELFIDIETEFNIEVDSDNMENIKTFKQLVAYIEAQIKAK